MTYRVSGSLTLHSADDSPVIDEQRMTNNPELGIQLVVARLLERLSTTVTAATRAGDEITVLVWAESVGNLRDGEEALVKQRMLDRARSSEQIDPMF